MSKFWSSLTHDLKPYVPGEQPRMAELVKLNTNESPLGPSPRVFDAIRAEAADTLRLYPDPQATALRDALAAYHKVRPEQVFVGNGSDEVLAHAFAALLKHDAPLLFPDITYSFYPGLLPSVRHRLRDRAARSGHANPRCRLSPAGRRDHRPQSERADGDCVVARRDRDPAGGAPGRSRCHRRGLCRFRRRDRYPAGRVSPESSGRSNHVKIPRRWPAYGSATRSATLS